MRRFNQFLYHLFLRLVRRAAYVGSDVWQNRYYTLRGRRFVVYGQSIEASTVPPSWHGWLHYTTDAHPGPSVEGDMFAPYFWQKAPLLNLTGTVFQHVPQRSESDPSSAAWRPPSTPF